MNLSAITNNWLYYYVSVQYFSNIAFQYYAEIYYPVMADNVNNILSVSSATATNQYCDGSYPLIPSSSSLYIGAGYVSSYTPFYGIISDIVLITNSYTASGYQFYLRHGTTRITLWLNWDDNIIL